jgi:hypothetical protein
VKHAGKIYCWDWGLKRIVEIKVEPVLFAGCPEDVFADILCAVEESVRDSLPGDEYTRR